MIPHHTRGPAITLFIAFLWAGCASKDSTLFVTKTSFGVDFDAKPPTMDVGYSRKEGTIAPKFEDGNVIPQMASFHGRAGVIGNVFIGAAQSFAVGEPSVIMAKYMGNPNAKPAVKDVIDAAELAGPHLVTGRLSQPKRYFFGTDTSLGVKVGLAAETGGVPDSLSVGWKRKELAYVPLTRTGSDATMQIAVPSLLSTVNFGTNPQNGATTVSQFFATGSAANYLAAQPDVRAVLGARIVADTELAERLDAEARKKADAEIEAIREKVRKLRERAAAAVAKLDTHEKLDAAYRYAIAADVVTADDPLAVQQTPPHTVDQRKQYLIGSFFPGDRPDLPRIERYVTNLESIR